VNMQRPAVAAGAVAVPVQPGQVPEAQRAIDVAARFRYFIQLACWPDCIAHAVKPVLPVVTHDAVAEQPAHLNPSAGARVTAGYLLLFLHHEHTGRGRVSVKG